MNRTALDRSHPRLSRELPLPEVSVVMPCLNEADTLATCIRKAWQGLDDAGVDGEVIVADNGSIDGSREIALAEGAHVVDVPERGYGRALIAGIAAASGRYVIMGDADDSYDFTRIPRFVERLREGYDLVQGCRMPSGGGRIAAGAMPLLHRFAGNPLFSSLVRGMFDAPLHDVLCGLRGFSKAHYDSLRLRCAGMEFAVELVIKSVLQHGRMTELPITLHRDGRKHHAPHLRTFRDGWRTLRMYFMLSPRWLFLLPGSALLCAGTTIALLALLGLPLFDVQLGPVALAGGSLAMLVGQQCVFFALFAKCFAVYDGLLPPDVRMDRFFERVTLEHGLLLSAAGAAAGFGLLACQALDWPIAALAGVPALQLALASGTLLGLSAQTFFFSFMISLLGMRRR